MAGIVSSNHWICIASVGFPQGVSLHPLLHLLTKVASYGTFVFNGLVKPPIFPPPPSVHLPHEPELEETGEVPAAGAQGRSGYDVIPEEENP